MQIKFTEKYCDSKQDNVNKKITKRWIELSDIKGKHIYHGHVFRLNKFGEGKTVDRSDGSMDG